MTTVSIITPCYNGERYIRETLESALNQTHAPLEVIVVDDGSTDDSAAIAESFGPPVRVIRQENHGESVARNRAIAEAQGTYLLFLDADDLLHEDALHRLIKAVGGDEMAVGLMGHRTFMDGTGETISEAVAKCDSFFPTVISKNPGLVHAYLTPTRLARQVGGFCDELTYFEDWDFWCQLALTGAKLVPIDLIGALYRRHPHAQTPTAKKSARKLGHVAVVERMLEGMLKQPDLIEQYAREAFWSGWAALRSAKELEIEWEQLTSLVTRLEQIVAAPPEDLRRSRFVRLVRLVGVRKAWWLQNFISPRASNAKPHGATLPNLQPIQQRSVGEPAES